MRVVYKPIAGERPLWDFPHGTLAAREVGSYAVSEALGWDIVPPTVLGDGPHGPGMVQLWRDEVEDAGTRRHRRRGRGPGRLPTRLRRPRRPRPGGVAGPRGQRAPAADGALRRRGQQRRPQGRARPAHARRPPARRRPRTDLPRRAQAPHRAVGLRGRRDQRRGDRRPAQGSRRRSTASWARRCPGCSPTTRSRPRGAGSPGCWRGGRSPARARRRTPSSPGHRSETRSDDRGTRSARGRGQIEQPAARTSRARAYRDSSRSSGG